MLWCLGWPLRFAVNFSGLFCSASAKYAHIARVGMKAFIETHPTHSPQPNSRPRRALPTKPCCRCSE